MSVRSRTWKTSTGDERQSWVVDYKVDGERKLETFDNRNDAEAFWGRVRERRDIIRRKEQKERLDAVVPDQTDEVGDMVSIPRAELTVMRLHLVAMLERIDMALGEPTHPETELSAITTEGQTAKFEFTGASIEALPHTGKRYEVRDTLIPGFRCRVSDTGRKTLVVTARFDGKNPSRHKIGIWPFVTMDEARRRAIEKLKTTKVYA